MSRVLSSSSVAFAATNSIVIPKPSGLVVGDLLLGYCLYKTAGGTNMDLTPPAGWTVIDQVNGSGNVNKCTAFYKIATSTETAATDFTFTVINQTASSAGGGLLRIEHFLASGPIDTYSKNANDTATTTSWSLAGVDPANESSLLVMIVGTDETAGAQSVSAQAVTTSNPVWTEIMDLNDSAITNNIGFAIATATRTAATATGNATATLAQANSGNARTLSFLIAIAPGTFTDVSDTAGTPTEVVSMTVTMPVTASDISGVPTESAGVKVGFSNQTKSSTSWTNLDKS